MLKTKCYKCWGLKAKIPNRVLFTNLLPKWVCFIVIYQGGLFFYYNALLLKALSTKTWHVAWRDKLTGEVGQGGSGGLPGANTSGRQPSTSFFPIKSLFLRFIFTTKCWSEIVEVSSVESDLLLLYVSLLKRFIPVRNFAQN